MLQRWATEDGTSSYRRRFAERLARSHFRQLHGLWIASIGISVRVVSPDPASAARWRQTVELALESGCNLVDVSPTYTSRRSEQIVGQALARVFAKGRIARNELIVAARGGIVDYDGERPTDLAAYVRSRLIDPGVAAADEFAQDWHHCISPRYLRQQFKLTLTNLGLGTVDVYYLHRPEVQRVERGADVFEQRLRAAFAELEAQGAAERLAWYGLALDDGLRVPPDDRAYVSLSRVVDLAREVGGASHRLGFIQAPHNLAMREIMTFRNQIVDGRELTALEAAAELGLAVVGSSALWGGQLAWHLPSDVRAAFPEARTNAQAAVQFARSAGGLACALVGMHYPHELEEIMAVARWPLAPAARLTGLL